MQSHHWIFIPGIFGSNAALRCVASDKRFDMRDLPKVFSIEKAARRLADEIGSDGTRCFVAIGNSYGALVALRLAELLSNSCQAIVLINPPLKPLSLRALRGYAQALLRSIPTLLLLVPGDLTRRLREYALKYEYLWPAIKEQSTLQAKHRSAVRSTLASTHILLARAYEVLWRGFFYKGFTPSVPCLVINTQAQDVGSRTLPMDCIYRVLSVETHFPLLENLEDCISVIEDWLSSVQPVSSCTKLLLSQFDDSRSRLLACADAERGA